MCPFSPSGGHVGEPPRPPAVEQAVAQSSTSGSCCALGGKQGPLPNRGSPQHVHIPRAWTQAGQQDALYRWNWLGNSPGVDVSLGQIYHIPLAMKARGNLLDLRFYIYQIGLEPVHEHSWKTVRSSHM